MKIRRAWSMLLLAGLLSVFASRASAELVGQWTFNLNEELVDKTGNFPDLALKGNASVTPDGELDVNGSGTTASGWAVTQGGAYGGPAIGDKTLVSWITLQSLGDVVRAGSAITIDRTSGDHFDGIIFGERQTDRWMNGSSNFGRTDDFVPGFAETTTGEKIQMAITYTGGQITGYRNGEQIGQYNRALGSWNTGDAEVFFGQRHGSTAGGPGGLDALIDEARIYDTALTQAELQALAPTPNIPEPSSIVLAAMGLLGVLTRMRRRRGS